MLIYQRLSQIKHSNFFQVQAGFDIDQASIYLLFAANVWPVLGGIFLHFGLSYRSTGLPSNKQAEQFNM